ncbi:hypothetical protein K4F52_007454 [Lecanicillium sp. MT-2017a]|nr:hypothetical protein K4F52_007454 [Lecanicillium sp. MT-2017a]
MTNIIVSAITNKEINCKQAMKAVQILGDKAAPQVRFTTTLSPPSPTSSEILIRVAAAGVTADEVTWPELYETSNRVPGHDVSGTVHALGPAYTGPLKVGDEVFAMIDADRGMGMAEFAILAESEAAKKPATVSHAQAAALPIPLLTAWEAAHRHLRLEKGARVLVTGASGAVGRVFVQIAARVIGADVVALASAERMEMVKEMGAASVLDYKEQGWEDKVGKIDAVFDTVGGNVLKKCWMAVKEDGALVTVGDPAPDWAFGRGEPEELKLKPGVRALHFIVEADGKALDEVGRLVESGVVGALDVREFKAEEAVEAWEFAGTRGRTEKAVVAF